MPIEQLKQLLRTRRRRLVAGAIVLVVVLAGFGLRLAIVGADAAGHLQRAATLVGQLESQLRGGDLAAARVTAADLRRQTAAARADAHGPSWWLGSALPVAGDDLTAVGAVADAVDALAAEVVPPLLDAADGMTDAMGGAGKSKNQDLRSVASAAPRIAAAAAVAEAARQRLAKLDRGGLNARVRTALDQVDAGLDRVVPLLDPAARAAKLLPALLGADGPRTYLVLFQNLAEVRATGGMPGAFAVVQADHGQISLVEQGTAAKTLRDFDAPVLPLDADQEDLFTNRLGTYPADVNLTPDFPTAAALIREMYRQRSGRAVDGVLATDPVALAYLLSATGPVDVPAGGALGGRLTGATAVRQLLSEVYLKIAAEPDQDAYFAGAAKAVLDKLMGGVPMSQNLVQALARATDERRLLAWSAHPQEQTEIARTPFAGTLPERDGRRPTVGVFLNDGTGAKLGYYLTRSVQLDTGRCLDDGSRPLRLTVTLGSNAPKSGLPRSVLGLSLAGEGVIRTNVLVYAPTGGSPVAARQDGTEVDFGTGYEKGREVAVFPVDLAPGATSTIVVDLVTAPLDTRDAIEPRLITTPGIQPWATRLTPGRQCRN
ncbi:DUF4012 domain-containing protein [Dactylosporangium vinaceum]|uniref:DUF4012 domain-containing protein n=1 Tax=Dactylosporangium vinaceum TaxID=53362 RepID=A0ABV5MEU9_9ACTN|nr:DUF4012 domain-containing protein [Dactylosporangium vinaceum]UAB97085.1 DUF4012 domain-containing protein [Dactylosporangium vinaceum]